MTDKEVMAMALEVLECANSLNRDYENEIAAFKERLAQEKALQTLHNENERLGLYRDAYAEQEPVAWMYDDDYQRMLTSETFCKVWSLEVGSAKRGVTTVPLYTTPPQRTEQNFCPRCGKRTPDLITIHTCTPPKD